MSTLLIRKPNQPQFKSSMFSICRSQWHDMNCLRPLKHWDRGFESHLRHGCLCVYSVFVLSCVQVAALRRADPPSKESYQLCKRSRN
jgi:hypothetical protein